MTDPRAAAAIVLAASAALLGGAFAFQHLGGLAPCVLCVWQRYPHGIVIALALAALALAGRPRAAALGLAGAVLMAGAGIAVFHVGVEQGWWQGTSECGSATGGAATLDELRRQLMNQPIVRCTEVAWSLFGISMAGYNALFSALLGAFAAAVGLRALARPAP